MALKNMPAGILDRRVRVQIVSEQDDAAGDPVRTWSDGPKRWASMRTLSMVERVAQRDVVRDADCMIVLRYDTESLKFFPETHRFTHTDRAGQERIYEIVGIGEDSSREDGMKFLCCFRPDGRGDRGPIGG